MTVPTPPSGIDTKPRLRALSLLAVVLGAAGVIALVTILWPGAAAAVAIFVAACTVILEIVKIIRGT